MTVKRKLGKGLGSIIAASPTPATAIEHAVINNTEFIVEINVDDIVPNPDQPREHFDESKIQALAESIKSAGLIEPIIVRKYGSGFSIVAGERRLRAIKRLGMKTIRSVVIEANDEKNFTIALIENIQREALDPVEEAKAYRMLAEKFGLKHQEIAERVGKDRASVSNSMRILNLDESTLIALSKGEISAGHAKLLLAVPENMRAQLRDAVIEKGLPVRALEKILKEMKEGKPLPKTADGETQNAKNQKNKNAHIKKMEEKLRLFTGTKVEIRHSGKKGKIEISYYTPEDFDRIVDIICSEKLVMS